MDIIVALSLISIAITIAILVFCIGAWLGYNRGHNDGYDLGKAVQAQRDYYLRSKS